MKRMSIWMLVSLLAVSASAQKITTQQETIDCGQVLFRNPVTAEFPLKNAGNKALRISQVRKSCGCTEVEFPERDIAPGDSFMVRATFDAKQMGTFIKQIGLFSNADEQPFVLTMRGKVVDKVVDFVGNYDYQLGKLKTDLQDIEFDDINRGDRPVQRIHVMNPTDEVLQPVMMHLPPYLTAHVSPSRLAPHHSGVISIVLDSRKLRDLGLNQTSIYLGSLPGDKVAAEKEIPVSAVLLPNFDNLSGADKAVAPRMVLSNSTLDLGAFGSKKKLKGEILITNEGKSMLEIRSMQMFTMGLQVSLNKTKLQPGESAKLKITAIANELKKSRSKKPRVLMITNDPDHAKVIVKVKVQ